MSRRPLGTRGERARAAAAAIVVNLFLGAALVTGLALREERRASQGLETFDVILDPPPAEPEPEPEPVTTEEPEKEPEGAAGREASAVVAPPSPVPRPATVTAAPLPASGSASTSGNSDRGQGPGAGGSGSGSGGGGAGGSGSGLPVSRAHMIRGMIADRDNPGGRHVGRVVVNLAIAADGRVTACRLVESSGNPATDALTCRLSYRIIFRPARLGSGRPVPDDTFYVVNWRRR